MARRRRPLTPEQLREIAEAASRPLATDGWLEGMRRTATDPDPKKPEAPATSSTTGAGPRTR